ncbi:MAG: tetratricopeptide repeat protein [Oligoflexus sp.]
MNLRRKIWLPIFVLTSSMLLHASCSSLGGGGSSDGDSEVENLVGLDAGVDSSDKDSETATLSANNAVLTYSVSNNPMTTKQIDPKKAANAANRVARSINKNSPDSRREVTNMISLKKFSGANLDEIFQMAKQLATSEMQRDIRRQLPEHAKLELALASIQVNRFSMAEYWLDEISSTKNKRLKAAELTARGIIAKADGRLPEAVDFWNQAIRQFPNYEPAKLNIGFTALMYGDAITAKKHLGNLQSDFFASVGLMQAERLSNNANRVESLCNRIKSQASNYKPALFSCALNTYQGQGNLPKARQELEAATKADGGPSSIDEKIFVVIGRIDNEMRQAQAAAQRQQQSPQAQQPEQK